MTIRLPNFITFTGVDDRTAIHELKMIHDRYPVEWGVLWSRDRQGKDPRYPSSHKAASLQASGMRTAAHLCGAYAREIMDFCYNAWEFPIAACSRVQVNTRDPNLAAAQRFSQMIGKRVILQTRDEQQFPANYHVDWLYDRSGGAGARPSGWPHNDWKLVGYAGGIAPDNVLATMEAINASGPKTGPYWIDMESGVRDENDQFSIEKVWAVCEAVYGRKP